MAIGLNLCVGYLGELSIGHAGFMCVGAFSSAFCTKLLQDSIQNEVVLFLIAIAVGTVAAAFFGFLIGIPVLRLRGDYLAIVTLALVRSSKMSLMFYILQKMRMDSILLSRMEIRSS